MHSLLTNCVNLCKYLYIKCGLHISNKVLHFKRTSKEFLHDFTIKKMKGTIFGLFFFHFFHLFILMNGRPTVELDTLALGSNDDYSIVFGQTTNDFPKYEVEEVENMEENNDKRSIDSDSQDKLQSKSVNYIRQTCLLYTSPSPRDS